MYVLVCGSREFDNYQFLKSNLDSIVSENAVIVSGGASGADELAEWYCADILRREPVVFEAEWGRWGKLAGPLRNQKAINYLLRKEIEGNDVICAAFLVNGAENKGTKDTIKKARIAGIKTRIFQL